MSFEQTLQRLLDGLKRKDLDQVLSTILVDENVRMIIFNGASINGRVAFINLHTAWFADQDWQMDVKILRVIETAEMAFALMLVDYNDVNLGPQSSHMQQYLSLVFIKKEDKWVLVLDQCTIATDVV